jgi:hypothetical protein
VRFRLASARGEGRAKKWMKGGKEREGFRVRGRLKRAEVSVLVSRGVGQQQAHQPPKEAFLPHRKPLPAARASSSLSSSPPGLACRSSQCPVQRTCQTISRQQHSADAICLGCHCHHGPCRHAAGGGARAAGGSRALTSPRCEKSLQRQSGRILNKPPPDERAPLLQRCRSRGALPPAQRASVESGATSVKESRLPRRRPRSPRRPSP